MRMWLMMCSINKCPVSGITGPCYIEIWEPESHNRCLIPGPTVHLHCPHAALQQQPLMMQCFMRVRMIYCFIRNVFILTLDEVMFLEKSLDLSKSKSKTMWPSILQCLQLLDHSRPQCFLIETKQLQSKLQCLQLLDHRRPQYCWIETKQLRLRESNVSKQFVPSPKVASSMSLQG